ncbi:hypothetical protein AB0M34_33200 [Nocardia sp. NPDC050193]
MAARDPGSKAGYRAVGAPGSRSARAGSQPPNCRSTRSSAPGHSRFTSMLARWWGLDAAAGLAAWDDSVVLRSKIHQHVLGEPGRWSSAELFDELGAVDRRFAGCLEGLVAATVLLDEDKERRIVEILNRHLCAAGIRLHETRHPLFRTSISAQSSWQHKSLIFAPDRTPDVRVSDAIDNDIDIFDPAEAAVYDRPIGRGGLCWKDLQQWWRDHRLALDADTIKKQVCTKLRTSPPDGSLQNNSRSTGTTTSMCPYTRVTGIASRGVVPLGPHDRATAQRRSVAWLSQEPPDAAAR